MHYVASSAHKPGEMWVKCRWNAIYDTLLSISLIYNDLRFGWNGWNI